MNKKFWTPILQLVAGSVIFSMMGGAWGAFQSELSFRHDEAVFNRQVNERLTAIETKLGELSKESQTNVAINP